MANCEAIIVADSANVRLQPNTASGVVGVLTLGKRAPAHQVTDPDAQNFRWVKVTVPANGLQGWVRGDLVQLSGDCADLGTLSTTVTPSNVTTSTTSTTPATTTTASQPVVLTGDCQAEVSVAAANVRREPTSASGTLGMILRGTKFAVKSVSTPDSGGFRWFGLDFQGQQGWIRQDLLRTTGDCLDPASHETASSTTTTTSTTSTTSGDCQAVVGLPQINVRAQATSTSKLVGTATAGESMTVKEVTAAQADGFRWVKVDFRGQNAFVRSDLVTLIGNCAALTGDERLAAPVAATITQGFKSGHPGMDFGATIGMELRIAAPATVFRAHVCTKCTAQQPNIKPKNEAERNQIFSDPGWGFGYGNHIIVRHEFQDLPRPIQEQILLNGGKASNAVFVLYAHLSRMDVQVNQKIAAGMVIGATGHTGNSTGPHLHIEVAVGDQWGTAKKVHPMILFAVPNITT